jgi:uncharacterized membrane protein
MVDTFLIALRESFQGALLLALVLFFQPIKTNRTFSLCVACGVLAAFLTGFPLGYITSLNKNLPANETWTFWRYVVETLLFYSSIVVIMKRMTISQFAAAAGLFLLGLSLFFFEARSLGFLVRDLGVMQERVPAALAAALLGVGLGFSPLLVFNKKIQHLPLEKAFIFPSLLMTLGALQYGFGGVAELERENIMVPLQRGLLSFLGHGMQSLQSTLMLSEHPFLKVPFSGLAQYLSGDRMALGLTVVFIMAPPLLILIHLFARPDPQVSAIPGAAQRRRKVAVFRDELLYQTTPVLTVFIVLVVMLHAVNVSMNPLYEPAPIPVREAQRTQDLKIPLSDKSGDLSDKKLRKYVYYYGNKQIIFLALLKADGSVGVALDECEICRPAEWNTDAKGYAQKGEHLICKYCMTPVAASTLNNPGGCNPIPIPFKMEDNRIVISLNDLIPLYKKVQELEKKGTHL